MSHGVKGQKGTLRGLRLPPVFDLGAHNIADLDRIGFKKYPDLYKKLKKYLRLQQQDACTKLAEDMLANEPFTVTEEEAREIDRLVFQDKLSQFQKNWDKAVLKGGKKFAELDPRQQTVLASRAYQHGPNWMDSKLTPDMKAFKNAALKGDWAAAQKYYNAAYNLKIERYKQESNLLLDALSSKSKKNS